MAIKKILVANRGEIAVRIMRACREMDIATVAIYSEADRNGLHVRYADEAYCIGPPPSGESYLRIDKIIDTALKAKVAAIHPGYGFLAENSSFVEACEANKIVYIGPNSRATKLLGDKTNARKAMSAAGVAIVPGTKDPIKDEKEAAGIAAQIGYPVLIKAAGGGGGKGMRIVDKPEELARALKSAAAEAASAFGDPTIYIEKYITQPRHVEIQILADNHGNVVHLNERECSVQRRYQKMIEESPSPIVNAELRQEMGEAAKKAARAANYNNAGTVEFLVDAARKFYFLEVNARLQVEHPVTELVTGIDIVKEQINIAGGEELRFTQAEIPLRGAALECRISAEDPDNSFMPSTGRVVGLSWPGGPGVRVESGISEGFEIPIYYDPLIAKLLTWGKDRNEAIGRMRRALDEFWIKGVKTTTPFHRRILDDAEFLAGQYDTHFVARFLERGMPRGADDEQLAVLAAVVAHLKLKAKTSLQVEAGTTESKWRVTGRWQGMRR